MHRCALTSVKKIINASASVAGSVGVHAVLVVLVDDPALAVVGVPDGGKVGPLLGVRDDVPGGGDARGEGAGLGAALPRHPAATAEVGRGRDEVAVCVVVAPLK